MSTNTPTAADQPAPAPAAPREPGWYIPWVVVGIAVVYLLSAIGRMNPPSIPYDLNALAKLPVVDGGRVKPLETVARVYLRQISHREYFVDDDGATQPAIKWYLDVLASGHRDSHGRAWKYRVFRVENDQLLAELKLKPREGLRYSLDELAPGLRQVIMTGEEVQRKIDAQKPVEVYEEKVHNLYQKLRLFFALAENHDPLVLPPQSPGEEWKSLGKFQTDAKRAALAEAFKPTVEALVAPERFAKLTDEQRGKLLTEIGGYEKAPADPAKVSELLLGLLREDPTKLSADDLQARLLAVGDVMTEEERTAIVARTDEALARRLAANSAAMLWVKMVDAYRAAKPSDFNAALDEYKATALSQVSDHDLNKVRGEAFYNRFAPFYHCTALYVLVALLCCLSWLGWTEPLRKSAFYVLYLTLIIHTGALIARMYFQDRWSVFVTNLYSSAVFIGWGCVVMGLILEKLYPIGIGNLVAAVLGVATTIISHNLATSDTLEMMRAVLDTNFWLSTHVTTVTFGYTATFVAGFIAVAYVARMLATVIRDSFRTGGPAPTGDLLVFALAAFGLMAIPVMLVAIGLKSAADFEVFPSFVSEILTFLAIAGGVGYALALVFARASAEGVAGDPNVAPRPLPGIARPMENFALDADANKKLTNMIYGVVCFATLLSFVGTVLGGIWADQSWGRFWGWDPKENGAVLIVLWNALILHARWCGLVRDRGLAVLAIAGNMVTAWSWFGTNQLGIGLHAYGFDKRLAAGCRYFWLSQLVIIGLGLIPRSYWTSATRKPVATPTSSSGGDVATLSAAATTPSAPPTTPAVNGTNGHPRPGHGKGKRSGKKR